MIRLFALLCALILPLAASAEVVRDTKVPMQVVQDLDLERYMGRWFEIARFPNRFERDCAAVTADYALQDDGTVSVLNSCRKGKVDGRLKTAKGVATVEGPGKLRVNFVRWLPFAAGDYWVLYVSPSYSVAVVGSPKGKFGWVLARKPKMSAAEWRHATRALEQSGYDISKLEKVRHAE